MSNKQNDIIAEQNQENKTMHTPTPWKKENDISGYTWIISEETNTRLATVHSTPANAEFIVTACNNHKKLFDALTEAEETITAAIEKEGFNADKDPLVLKLRQVITEAHSPKESA